MLRAMQCTTVFGRYVVCAHQASTLASQSKRLGRVGLFPASLRNSGLQGRRAGRSVAFVAAAVLSGQFLVVAAAAEGLDWKVVHMIPSTCEFLASLISSSSSQGASVLKPNEFPLLSPKTAQVELSTNQHSENRLSRVLPIAGDGRCLFRSGLPLSDVAPSDHAGGLPGSDQKRGWLFATYAILRIHFSPLTHIPRALRLRARMAPKTP
eukprot:1195276-Prorocentrum_minimum.AAC.1